MSVVERGVSGCKRFNKMFTGKTIDDLVMAAGINSENLKKTVALWNRFCKAQKDNKFGRITASPVCPSIALTKFRTGRRL